jgi:hypothetical protein
MPKAMELPFPPHWINAYLYAKLAEYEDIAIVATQQLVPIFAMTPTSTEEVYRNVLQSSTVEQPLRAKVLANKTALNTVTFLLFLIGSA